MKPPLSEVFSGIIVIDAMNSYSENFDIIDLGKDIATSEEVGMQILEARVVNAFNNRL
jgi:predicted dinucleotide-binding enzyme